MTVPASLAPHFLFSFCGSPRPGAERPCCQPGPWGSYLASSMGLGFLIRKLKTATAPTSQVTVSHTTWWGQCQTLRKSHKVLLCDYFSFKQTHGKTQIQGGCDLLSSANEHLITQELPYLANEWAGKKPHNTNKISGLVCKFSHREMSFGAENQKTGMIWFHWKGVIYFFVSGRWMSQAKEMENLEVPHPGKSWGICPRKVSWN